MVVINKVENMFKQMFYIHVSIRGVLIYDKKIGRLNNVTFFISMVIYDIDIIHYLKDFYSKKKFRKLALI